MSFKSRSGVAHILLVLTVISISALFFVFALKISNNTKIRASDYPTGVVEATPSVVLNTGSVTLSAKNVIGGSGAQIEYVNYYLINPALASGNTWGNPDWCSSSESCTQSSQGIKTYDLGQSSNSSNNYAVIWNSSTKSPHSSQRDRSLSPINIPPGIYKLALKIRDINGNETGNASETNINVIVSLPSPTPSPLSTPIPTPTPVATPRPTPSSTPTPISSPSPNLTACQRHDVSGDGSVDLTDALLVLNNFGSGNIRYDVNRDGSVDIGDALSVLDMFGQTC